MRRSRGRGTFWGDHPRRPTSVVLLRDGIAQRDASAAGDPAPAASWLARLDGPTALLAPSSWARTVRRAVGPVDVGCVESRFRPEDAPPPARRAPNVPVRRLTPSDAPAFASSAPSWSLLGWDSASELLADGAAFGVDLPGTPGFASLAWVQESAGVVDLLAVWTSPRFRRLGLGLATSSLLVDHVAAARRACPLGPRHRQPRLPLPRPLPRLHPPLLRAPLALAEELGRGGGRGLTACFGPSVKPSLSRGKVELTKSFRHRTDTKFPN